MSGHPDLTVAKYDDHLISIEDAQSGTTFHFAVGKKKGFRYIGIQTDPPQSPLPDPHPTWLAAAETTARDFAETQGWL